MTLEEADKKFPVGSFVWLHPYNDIYKVVSAKESNAYEAGRVIETCGGAFYSTTRPDHVYVAITSVNKPTTWASGYSTIYITSFYEELENEY